MGPDDVSDAEIRRQCEGELLKYRKAADLPVFANEEGTEWNDPLLWWKQNHAIYDNLWPLAKYYLAIPATSTLSERCFSAAGRILSSLRAGRMRSDNFEETYMVKQNMDVLPATPEKK